MGVSRYGEEFRKSAVQLVVEKGRPVQQVASELGVHVKTLQYWLRRHEKAQRSESVQITALERENRQLKKELADALESVDILKKTTAILSRR